MWRLRINPTPVVAALRRGCLGERGHRGDPRFEKIIEGAKQPVAVSDVTPSSAGTLPLKEKSPAKIKSASHLGKE
jgi:hypothetical protein